MHACKIEIAPSHYNRNYETGRSVGRGVLSSIKVEQIVRVPGRKELSIIVAASCFVCLTLLEQQRGGDALLIGADLLLLRLPHLTLDLIRFGVRERLGRHLLVSSIGQCDGFRARRRLASSRRHQAQSIDALHHLSFVPGGRIQRRIRHSRLEVSYRIAFRDELFSQFGFPFQFRGDVGRQDVWSDGSEQRSTMRGASLQFGGGLPGEGSLATVTTCSVGMPIS